MITSARYENAMRQRCFRVPVTRAKPAFVDGIAYLRAESLQLFQLQVDARECVCQPPK